MVKIANKNISSQETFPIGLCQMLIDIHRAAREIDKVSVARIVMNRDIALMTAHSNRRGPYVSCVARMVITLHDARTKFV